MGKNFFSAVWVVIAIAVIILIGIGVAADSDPKQGLANECLQGLQEACVYWQALEELKMVEAVVADAKSSYEAAIAPTPPTQSILDS